MRFRYVISMLALIGQTFLHTADAQVSYPIPGNDPGQSSPVVADIDGNPSNGQEIVVGTRDGQVHALHADGTALWSSQLPNFPCASALPNDKLYSSPVVGDLLGTGELHVVIGYGGFRGKACDGGVAALRGRDGSPTWTFSIKRWANRRGYDAFRNTVYGTPALGDVDGDGKLEIGFGSFDRNVYLLNSNGTVRWFYNAADTVFSSPLFLDIDADRRLEMLIGTDISQNLRLKPPTPNGGYLYALEAGLLTRGRGVRFSFRDPKLVQWKTEFDQVIQSSPVAGDLLPDNPGLEVVIGSGCFFPQGTGDRRGKWYKVVSARTGAVLKTLSTTACTPSPAAVGDVDGDGSLDVVVAVSGDGSAGGDGRSHLIAWNPATERVLWDREPLLGTRADRFAGHFNRQPVIADVDSNGDNEVLLAMSTGVAVFRGATGAALSCISSSCNGPSLRVGGAVMGRPAVADIDGDGRFEVIAGGRPDGAGALVVWRYLAFEELL